MSKLNGEFLESKQNITTSPTPIPATNLSGRRSMIIKNEGSNTIYLGGSTSSNVVAVADGYKLNAGDEKPFDVGDDIVLYGIVANGTVELRVLEGS